MNDEQAKILRLKVTAGWPKYAFPSPNPGFDVGFVYAPYIPVIRHAEDFELTEFWIERPNAQVVAQATLGRLVGQQINQEVVRILREQGPLDGQGRTVG
jgi:hypothetical protein